MRGLLILAFVLILFLGGAGAFLTYRVLTTHSETDTVTPTSYLMSNYISLDFTDRVGGVHEGWLLLGSRGAPTIILCHGYGANRSDMLPLGTILRDVHYNVYLFNFSGPKARENSSNLGPRQAEDLMQAIETVTQQAEVNPHRVGLFGTNVGGYAALVAAMRSPKVKALAVDTIYNAPERMFEVQIDQALGGSTPLFRYIADVEFHLFTWGANPYPIRGNLSKLQDIPKLFISGRDFVVMAEETEELYNAAPQPKQLRVLDHSQASLATASEKKEYESQVVDFFSQNLSLRAD